MEFARRAAGTAGDGYRIPDPSTPHGQMTVDALRLELLKESIRQELIVAQLAEQRELGPEVRRELRLENAGPLCAHTGAGLPLTTLPDHGTSPVRQDGQLEYNPLSSDVSLDEALMIRGGSLMLRRRPVKERIEEWYQPPWCRSRDEDNASLIRARWPTKTFSGVKRKRSAEHSAPNKEISYEQWTCTLCHVNTSSELSFKDHCAGQRHMSNVVDLELPKGTSGLKKIATAETYHGMQHNPWNCCICHVKCSGDLDLKCHLKGRRHQKNVEALWGESKEIEGNNGFQEAESYEKKAPLLADKNKRPASRWNCSICKAYCTSESDLDSHLRGRRHQQNVKAEVLKDNAVVASLVGGNRQQAVAVPNA